VGAGYLTGLVWGRGYRSGRPGGGEPGHERFSPALMLDVELTEPFPAVGPDAGSGRAWVLGPAARRAGREPPGPASPGGAAPGQLAGLLWPLFRDAAASRFAAAGLPAPATLPVTGAAGGPGDRPFHHGHGTVPAAPPLISVVVCARDRPVRLAACLRRLAGQEYPNCEIVVVDNAPASGAVAAVAGAHRGGAPCRYVAEPRRGLSWARNAGSAAAKGALRFAAYEDTTNAAAFIDFCKRLPHDAQGPVYLIVDGHPAHRATAVKQYVASTEGRLKLFRRRHSSARVTDV
jgi:hypothetical protein